MTMSYTRECNAENCSAMLKWNDSQKRYEDQLFPGEKHDHRKYMAALAQREEASAESKVVSGNIDTKNTVPPTEHIEGTECKGCAANGFENQIIFFRDDVRSKTNKKIPLEYAEKVQGQYIGHEHKTKDNPNPVCKPLGTPTESAPVKESAVTKPVDEGPPITGDNINDTMKAWTYELRQHNQWFAWIKPQIETIVGFINANSIQKANQVKSADQTQSN